MTRGLHVAVALPLLGLFVLAARGELALRSGESFRVGIRGYDPRDLISGHYLQYAYDFQWAGESTCGPTDARGTPSAVGVGCCVCLSRAGEGAAPLARQVECEAASACDAFLRADTVLPPRRYFIPERHAAALELALGERRAAVELTISPSGDAAVGALYLDGQPFRDVIGK